MSRKIEIAIRKALREDGEELAYLMDLAGDGLPAFLWSQMVGPGENVMEFGARRVSGTEGGFSYTNVHIASASGATVAILLSYRLPDPYETSPLDKGPEVIRPLLELEALAPGTWFINAIATLPNYRGQGIGTRLMQFAEGLARDSNVSTLSLIVAEGNSAAVKLYEGLRYSMMARRKIIPFPGCPHGGDWVLMQKSL